MSATSKFCSPITWTGRSTGERSPPWRAIWPPARAAGNWREMPPARSRSWSGAAVEPPPELVTRILFEMTAVKPTPGAAAVRDACWADGWSRCCSRAGDGHGRDGAVVLHAGGRDVRQLTPVGSGSGEGVDGGGESRQPDLGARREVLRESAAGVRNPDAVEGVEGGSSGGQAARSGERPERRRNERGTTIVGYCRACGKALDEANVHRRTERSIARSTFRWKALRRRHTARRRTRPLTAVLPPMPSAQRTSRPAWRFVLGLIPGVGAIYNGQYAKGLVHVTMIGAADLHSQQRHRRTDSNLCWP